MCYVSNPCHMYGTLYKVEVDLEGIGLVIKMYKEEYEHKVIGINVLTNVTHEWNEQYKVDVEYRWVMQHKVVAHK
jgi:hypothetical protein